METVHLYDIAHFRHVRYDDKFLELGETVVNCDNLRKPVIKYGNAPCELLQYYGFWFMREDAENALSAMGFERQSDILWVRKQ